MPGDVVAGSQPGIRVAMLRNPVIVGFCRGKDATTNRWHGIDSVGGEVVIAGDT